jgi:hypothetical protein
VPGLLLVIVVYKSRTEAITLGRNSSGQRIWGPFFLRAIEHTITPTLKNKKGNYLVFFSPCWATRSRRIYNVYSVIIITSPIV